MTRKAKGTPSGNEEKSILNATRTPIDKDNRSWLERPRELPVAMNRTSIKHIDSHGETPRFCTMTCPIDGGATLSCHRHTDMSTASATSGSYAARRFLDISSKNHSHRNALPHLALTNTYPSRFITYDDNRAVFNDKLTSRNRTCMMFLQGFARGTESPANS